MKNSLYLYIFFTSLLQLAFAPCMDGQKPNISANHESAPGSLLIKNVYLISREDTLGDIKVNLLIINKKLQLVTKDAVSFWCRSSSA